MKDRSVVTAFNIVGDFRDEVVKLQQRWADDQGSTEALTDIDGYLDQIVACLNDVGPSGDDESE